MNQTDSSSTDYLLTNPCMGRSPGQQFCLTEEREDRKFWTRHPTAWFNFTTINVRQTTKLEPGYKINQYHIFIRLYLIRKLGHPCDVTPTYYSQNKICWFKRLITCPNLGSFSVERKLEQQKNDRVVKSSGSITLFDRGMFMDVTPTYYSQNKICWFKRPITCPNLGSFSVERKVEQQKNDRVVKSSGSITLFDKGMFMSSIWAHFMNQGYILLCSKWIKD
jgi:hypothetical protein